MNEKNLHLKLHYWDIIALFFIYLFTLILIEPHNPAVFLLVLLLLNIHALRLRLKWLNHYLYIDMAFILVVSFFHHPAFLLVAPSLYFMARFSNKYLVLIALPGILIFEIDYVIGALLLLFAFASGFWIGLWQREKNELLKRINDHRRKLYEAQQHQTRLLESQSETARLATLSERDRIAQKLHDDLGHELTAGLLSLKAHQSLLKQGKSDKKMFDEALKRFDLAAQQLKNTVHNTKPLAAYGLEVFESQLEPIASILSYRKIGDINIIPAFLWQILHMTLKEAITNILKHTEATEVVVTLEVTQQIVKLEVSNDGLASKKSYQVGSGLTFMRQRIEHLDGSLSVQTGNHFKIIAVLPLKKEVIA